MRAARTGMAAALLLLPLAPLVFAACTDGVTPNCSDPTVQCGPQIDASGGEAEAALLPEAARKDTAAEAEAAADAPVDSADAGDEG